MINLAKMQLMERAIKNIGGEIIFTPRAKFTYRTAIFDGRVIWEVERPRNDYSGIFRVVYSEELKGEIA